MKNVLHIATLICVTFIISIRGKPVNSGFQTNASDKISNLKSKKGSLNNTKNSTIRKTIHNNLLSDLARISQDSSTLKYEETVTVNNQTKSISSPHEVNSTTKGENDSHVVSTPDAKSRLPAQPMTNENAATRTIITPTQAVDRPNTESYDSLVEGNKKNEADPAQMDVNENKNGDKKFSKLITSNAISAPENDEKANEGVTKGQEISPLISDRSENTPSSTDVVSKSSGNTTPIPENTTPAPQITTPAPQSTTPAPEYSTPGSNIAPSNDINHGMTNNGLTSDGIVSNEEQNTYKAKPVVTKVNENAGTTDEETFIEQTTANGDNDTVNFKDIAEDYSKTDRNNSAVSVIVCPGQKHTISCPSDSTLNIASASYGHNSNVLCGGSTSLPYCQASGVYQAVQSACQGQPSCLLQSDGQQFRGECPGTSNYLAVGYSCQNQQSSLSSPPSPPPPPPPLSFMPAPPPPAPPASTANVFGYPAVQTSPYIPHPVSTQPTTYSNRNYYNNNNYYSGYYRDNNPRKTNNLNSNYYNYYNYGNRGYYGNYNRQAGRRQPVQSQRYYGYGTRQGLMPRARPPPPPSPRVPPPPASRRKMNSLSSLFRVGGRYQNSVYSPYQAQSTTRYQDSFSNWNNYYNPSSNPYYGQYYYSTLPFIQSQRDRQYPSRNSYTASCYACQDCQQCSKQAYCQGCPKCKTLSCNTKPTKKETFMDPIDTLVEEFGRRTQGMTPMEMSAVVISPVPKAPSSVVQSTPLAPPPKPLEEDDDDSDEDEFEDVTPSGSEKDSDRAAKKSTVSSYHSEDSRRRKGGVRKDFKDRKENRYDETPQRRSKHWYRSGLFKHFVGHDDNDGDEDDDEGTYYKKSRRNRRYRKFSDYFDDGNNINSDGMESRSYSKRWNEDSQEDGDDYDSSRDERHQYEIAKSDYNDDNNIYNYARLFY